MARRLPDDFLINQLKGDENKLYEYPEIPFERGVNVTTQQYDIITKYLKNLQLPHQKRCVQYVIRAPRRCGKTFLFTRLIPLLEDRHKIWDFNPVTSKWDIPGTIHVMITAMTLGKVKGLYLKSLLDFSKLVGLGYRWNNDLNRIETPRGNFVWFGSLRDKRTADLVRGYKFTILIIDEAQSANDLVLKEFITQDAGPAMTDHGGVIALTGTEPKVPFGFWYDITGGGRGYEIDKLTIENNIFYPLEARERKIEAERLTWGWEKGNEPAWVKREYRGERVWDGCNTVFQYRTDKNHYTEIKIPKEERLYVIGVDLGFHDADAFAVLCYSLHSSEVYLVEEYVRDRQDISSCCDKVLELSEKYGQPPVIVDSGSIGRKVMEEMIQRYSINAEAAKKDEKGGWIQSMRTALNRGDLKIRASSEAVEEMAKTEWDEKQEGWKKDGFHPNLLDAMVYAFRDIFNMCAIPKEKELENPSSRVGVLLERMKERYMEVDDGSLDYGLDSKNDRGFQSLL